MEEYTQITLDQWMQWKEDIRQKLTETAGNFVYIGYRLKQIRDSGMFGGAADIFGFAEQEYGLGKSTTSRFIAINERYSEGGNSLYLREEFRNFSSSKLAEMLTLPDAECQLITDKTTVKEIRELKSFSRQQAEEAGPETDAGHTPLEKCIIDFFSQKQEALNMVMGYLSADEPGYREAEGIINPSGQGSHRKGIVFLFFYDWATGVKYKLLMQKEPVSMTWPEFLNEVYKIYAGCGGGDAWADFYKEQEQEKTPQEAAAGQAQPGSGQGFPDAVATSQQHAGEDEKTEDNEQERDNADTNGEDNSKECSREDTLEDIGEEMGTEEDPAADNETPGNGEINAEPENNEDGARGGSGQPAVEEGTDDEGMLAAGEGGTAPDAAEIEGEEPDGELREAEQMDITQFEEYLPGQGQDPNVVTGYLDALRDILDNIYIQAEQMQYSYAEDLLEAARGTLHKIIEVSGQNESQPGGQREENKENKEHNA